jgi:hypothetical protein
MRFTLGALLAVASFAADCSFRSDPDRFLAQEIRALQAVQSRLGQLRASLSAAPGRTVSASGIPRVNFIDDEILGLIEQNNVPAASLTTDEEFLRRVSFDLTGHPPSPAEIREFLANQSPGKRGEAIDRLLYSARFRDRWTLWLGDLLQNVVFPQNFDRQYFGRNAYYEWMLLSLVQEKSLRDLALEAVGGTGNNYDTATGWTNFPLNGITAMGPVQDTYDNIARVATTTFLGLSHYDCLLCHDGRRHLDQVSLWGATATRVEAMRMAAFFSRISMAKPRLAATEFYYNSYNVTDAAGGSYFLNTNYGNRPDRVPLAGRSTLDPEYRDGRRPEGNNWRQQFAQFLVDDPMFPVNFANRLWKEMFTLGLVEPVDSLDPARLDPDDPPPAPWTLQATHPRLLKRLAAELAARNYNIREFLRLLVESSAYQLSSRYEAEWKPGYVPLFARHYPRRLEGEEVHDAIVKATGVTTMYQVRGLADTPWAMQLADPQEPRANGQAFNFMAPFFRGNRDSTFRVQDGSVQQRLNLMNDPFVLNRMRVAASANLRAVAGLSSDAEAVEELFLLVLHRLPDEREKGAAVKFLSQAAGQRNAYIEDLAWTLVNKVDFLFNY